eukprot:gene9496-9659_t
MVGSVVSTSNGLAVGSKVGSYRVFGCNGTTTDDIIIRAVDRAVQDGCDIINLSLAGEAGYPDSGLYKTVMAKANRLGVLVVKAAGNNGDGGPFRADAATVGGRRYNSGTSFSAPYVAAVLALWLQYQQQQATASGKTLERTSVNQEAALRGLVATAGPVRDVFKPEFLEPIARCGGGYLQADAFILNQVRLDPMMIQLPSQVTMSQLSKVTVTWDGPAHPDGIITFDISHQPAVSITLGDGWYGTEAAVQKRFVSAAVTFDKASVTLDTTAARQSARFKVTFSLPEELKAQPLLYSGRILLTPRAAGMASSQQNSSATATGGLRRLVPVSVPYQGFSGPYDKTLRLMARPLSSLNQKAAAALKRYQDMLCYAPRSRPYYPNAILDSGEVQVPKVCSGGYTVSNNITLSVSLQVLRQSPECSLRIVLAPQVPIRTLTVQLLNSRGALLGSLWPLNTAPADSLGLPRQVASYCLRFNGSYVAPSSSSSSARRQVELQPGSIYRLKAVCEGPVAAADAKLGLKPATLLEEPEEKISLGSEEDEIPNQMDQDELVPEGQEVTSADLDAPASSSAVKDNKERGKASKQARRMMSIETLAGGSSSGQPLTTTGLTLDAVRQNIHALSTEVRKALGDKTINVQDQLDLLEEQLASLVICPLPSISSHGSYASSNGPISCMLEDLVALLELEGKSGIDCGHVLLTAHHLIKQQDAALVEMNAQQQQLLDLIHAGQSRIQQLEQQLAQQQGGSEALEAAAQVTAALSLAPATRLHQAYQLATLAVSTYRRALDHAVPDFKPRHDLEQLVAERHTLEVQQITSAPVGSSRTRIGELRTALQDLQTKLPADGAASKVLSVLLLQSSDPKSGDADSQINSNLANGLRMLDLGQELSTLQDLGPFPTFAKALDLTAARDQHWAAVNHKVQEWGARYKRESAAIPQNVLAMLNDLNARIQAFAHPPSS